VLEQSPADKIKARFRAQHPASGTNTPDASQRGGEVVPSPVRTSSGDSVGSVLSWVGGWGDSSKHSPWASFRRLDPSPKKPETFTESFIRTLSNASPSAAFAKDCRLSLLDMAYTMTFLCGIGGTSVWADVALPRICPAEDTGRVLSFNCIEGVIFSWIFATTVLWTVVLPYHAFNPWAAALASEFTARQRFMKTLAQCGAAALFAVLFHRAFGEGWAGRVYSESFPKMHLCDHPTATTFHRDFFKAKPCIPEWPLVDDGGRLHIGATMWEAVHTMVLNTVLGLFLPFVPTILAPIAVAVGVVSTIRSPWGYHTGPALNLAVASASAAFGGGVDAFRVHAVGTFIGVICAGYAVNGARMLMEYVATAWASKEKEE